MIFQKQYDCELDRTDGRLILTYVESEGDDLKELLANAMVSIEDWHGNEGPERSLDELPEELYELIKQDMTDHINCNDQYSESIFGSVE